MLLLANRQAQLLHTRMAIHLYLCVLGTVGVRQILPASGTHVRSALDSPNFEFCMTLSECLRMLEKYTHLLYIGPHKSWISSSVTIHVLKRRLPRSGTPDGLGEIHRRPTLSDIYTFRISLVSHCATCIVRCLLVFPAMSHRPLALKASIKGTLFPLSSCSSSKTQTARPRTQLRVLASQTMPRRVLHCALYHHQGFRCSWCTPFRPLTRWISMNVEARRAD